MNILLRIHEAVMMPVVARPPQWPSLDRRIAVLSRLRYMVFWSNQKEECSSYEEPSIIIFFLIGTGADYSVCQLYCPSSYRPGSFDGTPG